MKARADHVRMAGKGKATAKGASRASKPRKSATNSKREGEVAVVLLSGGNPRIEKADGHAPVTNAWTRTRLRLRAR